MKHTATLLLALLTATALPSCSDDDERFPDLTTNLADGVTNSQGQLIGIYTDDDQWLTLANPIDGLQPLSVYRCLCGYTLTEATATLYTLESVYYLRDSTDTPSRDPLTIVSVWQTPRYINLHLSIKTQGGDHHFGYITDSIADSHAYLSLHHRENNDPQAYSQDVYASIPWDSLPCNTVTIQGTYDFQR